MYVAMFPFLYLILSVWVFSLSFDYLDKDLSVFDCLFKEPTLTDPFSLYFIYFFFGVYYFFPVVLLVLIFLRPLNASLDYLFEITLFFYVAALSYKLPSYYCFHSNPQILVCCIYIFI